MKKTKEEWAAKIEIKNERLKSRAVLLYDLYKHGLTLENIGEKQDPPISKERVRQLLKMIGVSRNDGGEHIRTLINLRYVKKRNDRAITYMKTYGCSKERAIELNSGLNLLSKGCVAKAYKSQRSGAKSREIEWQLTFPEWIRIWEESGVFHLRGLRVGQYVMSRSCDVGPYSTGNVRIITSSDNVKEAREMDKVMSRGYPAACILRKKQKSLVIIAQHV